MCRLFCPVGLVLNEGVRVRKKVLKGKPKRAAPKARPAAAEPEDKGDLWRDES